MQTRLPLPRTGSGCPLFLNILQTAIGLESANKVGYVDAFEVFCPGRLLEIPKAVIEATKEVDKWIPSVC